MPVFLVKTTATDRFSLRPHFSLFQIAVDHHRSQPSISLETTRMVKGWDDEKKAALNAIFVNLFGDGGAMGFQAIENLQPKQAYDSNGVFSKDGYKLDTF